MYTNVRSILNKNKREELHVILNDKNIDILAITDSWTHEGVSDSEINVQGYTLFTRDTCNTNKTRGGGVLLFCKDKL